MLLWIAAFVTLVGAPYPAGRTTSLRVGFVGDVSFAGRDDAPGVVFGRVTDALAAPDLTIGNLEGLLLAGGAPTYREARLDISAAPKYAAAFEGVGFDLLGTANNHSWDAGAKGVLEHKANLDAVPTFGSAATEDAAFAPRRFDTAVGCVSVVPATLKSNRRAEAGAHVAWYGPKGTRPMRALLDLVRAERGAGCAPVVSIHWGREGRPLPDANVIDAGHALVEAGAALVVGHHPHVLQGVAWRAAPHGRGLIAWSLGNFVFRNRDPDKRRTGLLEITFARAPGAAVASVSGATLVPMTIDARDFAPRPATPGEIARHLQVLTERSAPFGTVVRLTAGRLAFTAP